MGEIKKDESDEKADASAAHGPQTNCTSLSRVSIPRQQGALQTKKEENKKIFETVESHN